MTIAVGIIAAAVYFCLIPSQTSISSISALAIIIAHYVPLHVSTVTMILNSVWQILTEHVCMSIRMPEEENIPTGEQRSSIMADMRSATS